MSSRPAATLRGTVHAPAAAAARPLGRRGGLWLVVYLTLMLLGATCVTGTAALAVDAASAASALALVLIAISSLWISGGAASALIGVLQPKAAAFAVPATWRPRHGTAILMLLCGEAAEPVASYLAGLRRRIDAIGLEQSTTIFVLSDTQGEARIAAEEAALAELIASGTVVYRRRSENSGRKPGNIADWLENHGADFGYMLVLDADSRMTSGRIRALIHRMEHDPRLGLLQAGIAMVPGRSLFGRHQRLASRLLSNNFGRGLAAWSGDAGNYWGHNAIMRVGAFRSAATLPVLSGRAPFGGPPLSHDFIEAAWIRRAGWTVALDPDMRGSAEDGPQTLTEFHRRDRRWCQGNLQHLRLIGEAGIDPVSRLHLASGVLGYLVAPIWMTLVLLFATGFVVIDSAAALLLIALILLLPKFCAIAAWQRRARTPVRRRLLYRAAVNELLLSTLIAPLIMLRQSAAVIAVFMGRDCGWKSSGGRRFERSLQWLEPLLGIALLALALASGSVASAAWLLPVTLPLILAPRLQRWLAGGA
ncbi:MAG: glucans biosynthesis glucosyltransferase MdoH [Halieaceae bacterium]|nr:glucans biosynthesis glucosyltransferase MdoH [Halieaceae bacterium]